MPFTRQNLKVIRPAIEKAISEIDWDAHGIENPIVALGTITFSRDGKNIRTKLEINESQQSENLTTARIKAGLAKVGDVVGFHSREGYKTYTVKKVNRTRYVGEDENGKTYTIPMRGCVAHVEEQLEV